MYLMNGRVFPNLRSLSSLATSIIQLPFVREVRYNKIIIFLHTQMMTEILNKIILDFYFYFVKYSPTEFFFIQIAIFNLNPFPTLSKET